MALPDQEMERINEVTTSATPINPNLHPTLRNIVATARYMRPQSMIISRLLNEFVANGDVSSLADMVMVLADKWDGAVDFWEEDSKSLKDTAKELRRKLERARKRAKKVDEFETEKNALSEKVQQLQAERTRLRREIRRTPRDPEAPRADGRARRACAIVRAYNT